MQTPPGSTRNKNTQVQKPQMVAEMTSHQQTVTHCKDAAQDVSPIKAKESQAHTFNSQNWNLWSSRPPWPAVTSCLKRKTEKKTTNQAVYKGRLRVSISLAQDTRQASCMGSNGETKWRRQSQETSYRPQHREFHGNPMEQ